MALTEKGVASLERVFIHLNIRCKNVEACASRPSSGYAPVYRETRCACQAILHMFSVLHIHTQKEISSQTSFCSYARPAQPGPNRTRLCGPCIAAIAGD